MRITYVALSRCVPDPEGRGGIWYVETTVSGTHVVHEYEVRPGQQGMVDIIDRVRVEAPFLLQGYVQNTARTAHQHVLDAIPDAFAAWQEKRGGEAPS
jgi:hypothetical protein